MDMEVSREGFISFDRGQAQFHTGIESVAFGEFINVFIAKLSRRCQPDGHGQDRQ